MDFLNAKKTEGEALFLVISRSLLLRVRCVKGTLELLVRDSKSLVKPFGVILFEERFKDLRLMFFCLERTAARSSIFRS